MADEGGTHPRYNDTGEVERNDDGEPIEAGDTVIELVDGEPVIYTYRTPAAQIEGGLLGVATGDALGSTVEFMTAAAIAAAHGRHTEMVGGGAFGWRPGQGTDDTDLTLAVARAYAAGYSLDGIAAGFLEWFAGSPADVGNTTAAALRHLRAHGDPAASGPAVAGEQAAGNGSLMRCITTGLVRTDADRRRREAAEISRVTHADPRCVDACVAYCDIVAGAFSYDDPEEIVESVLSTTPLRDDVAAVLERAPGRHAGELRPTGFVLDTLEIAVWAFTRDDDWDFESTLVEIVNLGGDADTTAACAGGLLGVLWLPTGMPERWVDRLEQRAAIAQLAAALTERRFQGRN